MKNRQKKSKYVVSAGSGAEKAASATAAGASEAAAHTRITSHGKIHNYAEFVNGSLQRQPERALFLYAQGAAVCKLVTVLEIVKRAGHARLTQSLTIGNTVDSPCSHRAKAPSAGSAESSAQGMYSSNLSKAFSQDLPVKATREAAPETEPRADTSKQPGEPWMEAELRIA